MHIEFNSRFCPIRDRQTAIKNMGGMVWLYEKHIIKFKNTYAGSYDEAHSLLMHGNTEDARILIHSVKGLAGTLGFVKLYYAASILERAILSSDPGLYNYLDIYKSCLEEILSSS